MKFSYVFLIVLAGTACKENSRDPDSLSAIVDPFDEFDGDSAFIGIVKKFHFSKANEIYIDLYSKDGINSDFEKLSRLADSVVYSDDENTRTRLPNAIAKKYFDLRGLKNVNIYDSRNKLVCGAEFVRFEFLRQNIYSVFIAVYKPAKRIDQRSHYAVSATSKIPQNVNYVVGVDSTSASRAASEFGIIARNYERHGVQSSFAFLGSNEMISVLNSDTASFVFKSSEEKFTMLYRSSEAQFIRDAYFIPVRGRNWPLILGDCMHPEGDMPWEILLFYNGKSYEPMNGQRVPKSIFKK